MTRRLVLSYVLVAAFVLLVAEVPLGLTYAGRAEDRLLADVERDARVLAGLLEERLEADDASAVSTITEQYAARSGGRVVVTGADGVSVVDTEAGSDNPRDFSTRPEMMTALAGSQANGLRRSETLGEEIAFVAVPISSDGVVTGVVRISFPTVALREQIRENWLRLGLLTVLVLAAAGSLGWLVARWVAGPVNALETGARRLAAGDLRGRAEVVRGPPELRQLADTFNDMAARIEVLVNSQRAFVADASHQLRTPLTALRLRIEALEDAAAPGGSGWPDTARADLDAVGAELDRLMGLVDGLLALARTEGSAAMEVVDLEATAEQAVHRWDALAAERSVALRLRCTGAAHVRCTPGGAEQVLDNLIDNALTVAPAGTTIDVAVRSDPDWVVLCVRDRGPGLPAADRRRAADRFWRGAGAEPGGTGLGLAIVSELVGGAGGHLELSDPEEGPGLQVEVRLPHARDTEGPDLAGDTEGPDLAEDTEGPDLAGEVSATGGG